MSNNSQKCLVVSSQNDFSAKIFRLSKMPEKTSLLITDNCLTIYQQSATLILPKRRQSHHRNRYSLLRRMAHRGQQSGIRRRHRHGGRPDVRAFPQRAKRHRTHAPAALLHGCLLAPALLETVAPPKRHTVDRRFRSRHCPCKFDLKGHFRRSPQEGDRRHRVSICRARSLTSVLATLARELGTSDQHSTPIQIVAGATCRIARWRIFNACAHGWACRRHVSPPATLK